MIAAYLCAHCVSPVPHAVQLLTFPRPPRIPLGAAAALVTLDLFQPRPICLSNNHRVRIVISVGIRVDAYRQGSLFSFQPRSASTN